MDSDFVRLIVTLVAAALGVALVLGLLVYASGQRRSSKRYRPGRPFTFTPVWFLAAPEENSRAGIVKALTAGSLAGRVARPRETGGASENW